MLASMGGGIPALYLLVVGNYGWDMHAHPRSLEVRLSFLRRPPT